MRGAVEWLCRLMLRIFFRRIEVIGASNVPTAGPVILTLCKLAGAFDRLTPYAPPVTSAAPAIEPKSRDITAAQDATP